MKQFKLCYIKTQLKVLNFLTKYALKIISLNVAKTPPNFEKFTLPYTYYFVLRSLRSVTFDAKIYT